MVKKYRQWLSIPPVVPFLLFVCLFTIWSPELQASTSTLTYDTVLVTVKSETGLQRGTITAKIANTPRKRYVGLRYVTKLDTNAGMLFLYRDSRGRNFTMVDVEVPLDIIFADRTGRIRSIHTAQPGEKNIRSEQPARYVLETNAGWARRRGVRVGDLLRTTN